MCPASAINCEARVTMRVLINSPRSVFLAESLLFFPSIFSLPFTLSAQVQTGVFTVVFAVKGFR